MTQAGMRSRTALNLGHVILQKYLSKAAAPAFLAERAAVFRDALRFGCGSMDDVGTVGD